MQDIVDHTSAPMFSRYHLATRDVSDTTFIFIYSFFSSFFWVTPDTVISHTSTSSWVRSGDTTARRRLHCPQRYHCHPRSLNHVDCQPNSRRMSAVVLVIYLSTRLVSTPVALCFLVKPGALLSAGLVPMHEGTETREEANREITRQRT